MDKGYNEMSDKSEVIDVKQLSDQEVILIGNEMGVKVSDIITQACLDADKILNRYGLCAKMQFVIGPMVRDRK